jgi:uncharacterized protein YqeY
MRTDTVQYEKSILKKIEDGITETMRKMVEDHTIGGDRLNALKLIKSEFIRQNEKNYHSNLEYKMTDVEEVKVLLKMAEDHRENIEGYKNAGNVQMADKENSELDVINEFTPAQPTEEEMSKYVDALIDTILTEKGEGYQLSQRDMGTLMRAAKMVYPNINGNIVKSVLSTRMS